MLSTLPSKATMSKRCERCDCELGDVYAGVGGSTLCCGCSALALGDMFRLANDPPPRKQFKIVAEPQRQRALFSGLDCLPGQADLFNTEGESDDG